MNFFKKSSWSFVMFPVNLYFVLRSICFYFDCCWMLNILKNLLKKNVEVKSTYFPE
jgi:hypothetical protein